jgi:hypothetical protein
MSWALASDPLSDDASNARWHGLAWLCATTSSAGGSWPQVSQPTAAPGVADFNRARTEADALARRASISNWSETSARTLMLVLASADGEFVKTDVARPVLAQRAKRLVLALDRLAYALNKNRGWRLKVDPQLNLLFEDVRVPDTFEPNAFSSHLRDFREALDKSG